MDNNFPRHNIHVYSKSIKQTLYVNKDDNIYKSKALESKATSNEHKHFYSVKSINKTVHKLVVNCLNRVFYLSTYLQF